MYPASKIIVQHITQKLVTKNKYLKKMSFYNLKRGILHNQDKLTAN